MTNVSHDPTRGFYAINPAFVESYQTATGRRISIVQSHGGISRQARKVIGGEQPAGVVTLGLFPTSTPCASAASSLPVASGL